MCRGGWGNEFPSRRQGGRSIIETVDTPGEDESGGKGSKKERRKSGGLEEDGEQKVKKRAR